MAYWDHMRCDVTGAALGLPAHPSLPHLPEERFLLARLGDGGNPTYLLAAQRALAGAALTAYLDAVSPHGCPLAGYLLRAYQLPDFPYPSILKLEHERAPDGLGQAYIDFAQQARRSWMAALANDGPGLTPVLAWQASPHRRFVDGEDLAALLAAAGVALPGRADSYLGRGLALLADPQAMAALPAMMSLGGVTKIRPITGREYPLWVVLPAHQAPLLASALLSCAEALASVA